MYPELMTKIAENSPLMGLMKIDQLAFISRSDSDDVAIKKMLRLTDANWVTDEVVAEGYVRGAERNARNTARLQFNYDLGIEVEILRYTDGENYPDVGQVPSCHLCHIGAHVEKGKEIPRGLQNWAVAFPMIQQVKTLSHTNPFLVESGRKYKYSIYDTRRLIGTYFKVIERIEKA